MYKNIDKQTKLNLKDLVEYQEGQVVSKTLVQNDYVSMTIFSFDKGKGDQKLIQWFLIRGEMTALCPEDAKL